MKKVFTYLFGTVLLFLGCANKNIISPSSFFPNKVGNSYVYRVTDSLTNQVYNLTVSVDGNTTLGNKPVTIWDYKWENQSSSSFTSSSLVLSNKDSTVFYNIFTSYNAVSPPVTNVGFLFKYPLAIGSKWQVNASMDTVKVISNGTIMVNGKSYANTFLIQDISNSSNGSMISTFWVTPYLGLTMINYKGQGVNQHWELLTYKVQ